MPASSHEPFKTVTGPDSSISPLHSTRSRKSSLYSLLTGKSDSVFSNPSQQTITAITSPRSSTTSFLNSPDNHSRPRLGVHLKKAKSLASMKGLLSPSSLAPNLSRSTSIAGPSNLGLSHSTTALHSGRMDFWMRPRESDEVAATESLDMDNSLAPSRKAENLADTPKFSIRVVGRGGQGSRPRRANKQHQLQRDQTAPISTVDPSDTVSTVPTSAGAVPGPTIVRVVGRGGLGSKRRVRLDSSPSPLPSSALRNPVVDSRQSRGSAEGTSPHPDIRVSGRGGAGSRPRPQVSSGSPSNMFKIRWRRRKKSSEAATSPISPSVNPLKLGVLRRSRANTLPSSSNRDNSQPLPTIPASPPNSTTIDFNSTSTLSVHLHLSDALIPAPVGPRTKIERTLGDTVPSNILLSTSANHIDTGSLGKKVRRQSRDSTKSSSSSRSYNTTRSRRRASVTRSLSSIGSFIRLPKPSSEVYIYTEGAGAEEYGYDEEEVCWVDNDYDSHSREGVSISPIAFSNRPPSPVPPPTKPKLVIELGTPTGSIVHSISPETDGSGYSSVEGYEDEDEVHNEDDNALSDLLTPVTPPNDTGIPDTPHSCDAVLPVSPIIFSERPVSILPPFAPRSENEAGEGDADPHVDMTSSTPRTALKYLLSEPLMNSISASISASSSTSTSATTSSSHYFELSPSDSSSVAIADLTDSPVRNTTLVPPSRPGWTGEWNRKDMQDVIRSLRDLK